MGGMGASASREAAFASGTASELFTKVKLRMIFTRTTIRSRPSWICARISRFLPPPSVRMLVTKSGLDRLKSERRSPRASPSIANSPDLVLDDLAGVVVDRVDQAIQETGDVLAPAHLFYIPFHGHEGDAAVSPQLFLEFLDAAARTLALIEDVGQVVLEGLVVEIALDQDSLDRFLEQ